MKISSVLGKVLSDALVLAKKSGHEFLTPEHLLRAALNTEVVCGVLSQAGTDLKKLRDGIDFFLDTKVPCVDDPSSKGPLESVAFQSVMNRAVFNCVSSERSAVDVTDVLVSMLDEKKNYCCYYLMISGVDRVMLLEAISRMRRQERPSAQPGIIQLSEGDPSVQGMNPAANRKNALERFTVDMTAAASRGEYDLLVGRQDEIERTIQILCRRVKNNPLHVGDAGVGKTAVTQGLAQRIVQGKVPPELKESRIFSLE